MSLKKATNVLMMSVIIVFLMFSTAHAVTRNLNEQTVTISYDDMQSLTLYVEALEAENKALKQALAEERITIESLTKANQAYVATTDMEIARYKALEANLNEQVKALKQEQAKSKLLWILAIATAGIAIACN